MSDKFIIYQLLPRLFGNTTHINLPNASMDVNGCGKFNAITTKALNSIKGLGVTHVWYTGVIEHATQTDYSAFGIRKDHAAVVKGKAGSPYAIKDYYDVDPDLAEDVPNRMQEFEALVARTHKSGLKALVDFVPNHVARCYHSDAKPAGVADLGEEDNTNHAFDPQNNFYYIPNQFFAGQFNLLQEEKTPYHEYPAKASGNDVFSAHPTVNDWYETVKLNYGVDYQGGHAGHFDPLPGTWLKMRDILPRMLFFLENHDEQRIASRFFAGNPWQAVPAMVVAATLSVSPVMIYAGQELGEPAADAEGFSGDDGRTTIFDYWSVDSLRNWYHKGKCDGALLHDNQMQLRNLYQRILHVALSEKAIREGEMFDLMYANCNNPRFNPDRQFVFLRKADKEVVLVCVNFDDKATEVAIHLPQHAFEYLGMPEGFATKAVDLLTGFEEPEQAFSSEHPYVLKLERRSGKILKMQL